MLKKLTCYVSGVVIYILKEDVLNIASKDGSNGSEPMLCGNRSVSIERPFDSKTRYLYSIL